MRTHLNLVVAGVLAAALAMVPVGAQRAQGSRDALVVSTAWLAQHLNDPGLVLLHLGVKTDYDASHIPGARFLTLNDIALTDQTSQTGLMLQMPAEEDLRARLEKLGISDASRIVVSYARDRIAAATRVLFTLDHAGLGARASLLDGGMEAWVREGRDSHQIRVRHPKSALIRQRTDRALTPKLGATYPAATPYCTTARLQYATLTGRSGATPAGMEETRDRCLLYGWSASPSDSGTSLRSTTSVSIFRRASSSRSSGRPAAGRPRPSG